MKLFARLFGRSRRAGQEPAAPAPGGGQAQGTPQAYGQQYPPQAAPGRADLDPGHGARISSGQPSTAGRGYDADATGAVPITVLCSRCGNQNTAGSRFCSNCGSPLGAGGPVEHASEQTSTISISGIEAMDAEAGNTGQQPVLNAEAQAAVDALPAGTALLVVRRGPNSGSRFLLDADSTTAGRHPQSDIFLDDVTVSRNHAEFRRHPGGLFSVADVGSLNGTYVGRQRIDEVTLNPGDEVQIGKYRLVFFPSRIPVPGA